MCQASRREEEHELSDHRNGAPNQLEDATTTEGPPHSQATPQEKEKGETESRAYTTRIPRLD